MENLNYNGISNFYIGVVEENYDPQRRGRIKVRCQSLYHNIDIEDIPYAQPIAGLAGKSFEVPAIGKLVNIIFLTDDESDFYFPYYLYSENYNENLKRKLKQVSDKDYTDFIALLFDQKTQIYIEGQKLTIDQLLNKITIDNYTINLELKDNERIINLGTRNADQDAVLGTNFFKWMDKFIDELASPHSLFGNMGAPIIKPKLEALCYQYKLLRPGFLSEHVKIVDNGEVEKLKRNPETVNNKNDIDLILPPEEEQSNLKNLYDNIIKENQKSCKELDEATPTLIKPLPPRISVEDVNKTTLEEVNKIWDRDSQNKIQTLHPEMRPFVIAFINMCEAKGIKVSITSAFRSIEKQIELIKNGNKNAATPGKSYHNYGLAIDIKLLNSNDWETVGKIGRSLGFRWGIEFKNPRSEPWHFDWGNIAPSTSELKRRYESGDMIDGFVRLDKKSTPPKYDYKGTEYTSDKVKQVDEKCKKTDDFNSSNDENVKANIEHSDENEEAPTPELENKQKEKEANKKNNQSNCTELGARAFNFFVDKGWTPEQSAGIVGNLMQESSLRINAVGDSGAAYGLAQWHPDRQANFYKRYGISIKESTFEQQLDFVDYELRTTHKHAGNNLKTTNTVRDAALSVNKYYEVSADRGHADSGGKYADRELNRITYSENIFNC